LSGAVDRWASPAAPLVDWQPFDDLVARESRFVLTTHVNPDGDGLGSEVGLALYLHRRGKQVTIVNDGALPENYGFLGDAFPMQRYDEAAPHAALVEAGALVVLDTSSPSRLGRLARHLDRPGLSVAVIDHHLGGAPFAQVACISTEACATGELVYEYIRREPGAWTRQMAEALYTALVTDTGSFRHSNTDPAAHAMAAHLIALGVEPERLGQQIFQQRHPGRIRFTGRVLAELQLSDDGTLAWLEVTRARMQEYGVDGQDTEGLVDVPRTLPGVYAVAMFTESPNGRVKVSLRSTGELDVEEVARRFGGGGHRAAAGAHVGGPHESARAEVLTALTGAVARRRAGIVVPAGERAPK
jgi:phosphoesterase RecJ-like protein